MNKKLIIPFLIIWASIIDLQAQKGYDVMDWKTDVTFHTWLTGETRARYALRQKELEKALTSKDKTLRYAAGVRERFKQLLPHMPQRTPLQAEVKGSLQEDGFRIEKILYQSTPGHHVTTLLYIPEGKGPFPGVLLFCGHENAGKATPSYQQMAALLARNGFVVLSVDPISQSERHQLTTGEGQPLTRGSTTEHTLLNAAANLFQHATAADILWDNVRAMDYLSARPEVDAARTGCIGNSGGAMQAMYFAAYDDRVKVVIPCSYFADREGTLATTGPADGCAQVPGEGASGIEMADLLIAAAPKPLLVLAGRYDFIPYDGTVKAYADLQKVYTALHAQDKISLFSYEDGHGLSRPKREVAATWLRRWLYNDPKAIKETSYIPQNEAALFVTATGVVNTALREQTLAERNSHWFRQTGEARKTFLQSGREVILQKISARTRFVKGPGIVHAENVGAVNNIEKVILRAPGQPPLPVLLKTGSGKINRVVILLHEGGKAKWFESAPTSFDLNTLYIAADLRGVGETADRRDANDPKYMNSEYRNAMHALHLGKPVTGQRLTDIQTILNWIGAQPGWKSLPVEMEAVGTVSWPALHAAVFFPSLEKVRLKGLLPSFEYFLKNPLTKDMYTWVIPGVLHYYDIPDLVTLAGDRVVIE